jgi:type I restriction enzyme S subunit
MKPETFFDNFELLASAPNGVTKLRELILQLAVQGKLLLQDERDEPVEILLEKIKVENRMKIKKYETLPPITPDDIGFKKPKQWSVEYLGNIAQTSTKGATPTTYGFQFQSEVIRFIKVETVKKGRILKENITEFISPEAHEAQSRSKLESDDILFSIAGTIGETCIVQKEDLPANTNQALAIIRGTKTVFRPDFLKLQLDSFVANAIKSRARGGAMYNISLGDLKEMIVFIPPLAEQNRIVAKVDQLMSLCDELEARQQKKRESRAHLNSAALDRLLAAGAPGEFAEGWRRISDNFDLLFDSYS